MTPPGEHRAPVRVGAVVVAALIAVVSLAVGGALGSWQWQRAHDRATPVEPDPRAHLADVMRPGQAGRGEGRLVEVTGQWANQPWGLVTGKEVDGVDAVLLLRPLTVAAGDTGTGASATLPVLAGWLPRDQVVAALDADPATDATPSADANAETASATLTGYVRSGEGTSRAPDEPALPHTVWLSTMSTAILAQHWDAPVYSYLVVADQPAPGWRALPAPPPKSSLDVRSVTYSLEWWLFGGFAAVIALRWIRDNGRIAPGEEDG